MIPRKKIIIAVSIITFLALGFTLDRGLYKSWFKAKPTAENAGFEAPAATQPLPAAPKDADENLKNIYQNAIKAREARLNDPAYRLYMAEGLEWKTVADFAPTDKNTYYSYAAFIYAEAGRKFPKEWVPWHNVGNAFMFMNEFGRAEQAYKKAIEIEPSRYEHYSALIDMLSNRGIAPTDSVISFFGGRFPKITVNQLELTLTYAKYLLAYGKNDETLALLKAMMDANPNDSRFKAEYDDLKKFLGK